MRALIGLVLSLCLSAPGVAQTPTAAGVWEGAIATPAAPLRVVVRLEQASDGGPWSGTIDIPSQGVRNAPLTQVAVDLSTVRFSLGAATGAPTFVGALSADGSEIAGRFTQATTQLAFMLTRNTTGVVTRQPRPQEPRPPLPYDADEVTFQSGEAGGVTLAGTVTYPRSAGRHPAVVLISPSGPQDRDATISDHKLFLVLADHLTRQGIVVLRVDDRGVGGSTGATATATSEDLIADNVAALATIKARPDVDPARVGLIGHGEGGIIAPLVATRTGDVRFLVLLAAPGVSGEALMLEQVSAVARAMKLSDEVVEQTRARQEMLYEIVRTETDDAALRDRVRAAAGAAAGDAAVRLLTTPWFKFFLGHDPATVLRKVTVPMLALNGGNDLQVSAAQNLPAIEAALQAAGNRDVTTRALPGLNHLFQTSRVGLPPEYGTLQETFAPDALALISDWILRRTPQ